MAKDKKKGISDKTPMKAKKVKKAKKVLTVVDRRSRPKKPAPSLEELLEDLKEDLGIDRLNAGSEFIYQLLLANRKQIEDGPWAEEDVVRFSLDGEHYALTCEKLVTDGDFIVMEGPALLDKG